MSERLRIAWLTATPSGDQRDFFAALARREQVLLTVIYCSSKGVKGMSDSRAPLGRGVVLPGVALPLANSLHLNPSIVSHLLRQRYNLVVVGGYSQPTMQLAMSTLVSTSGAWMFFGERPGMRPRSLHARLLRDLALLQVRFADGIVATGSLAAADYRAACGGNTAPAIYSLPYLVSLDEFHTVERTPRVGGLVRFLFCGQLVERKGPDVVIRAFSRLARQCTSATLTLVGDGPERSRLEGLVPPELRSRVRFLGAVPFHERTSVFAQADILVHPARHEGWGVVIQEAMAAGLPVISSLQTGAAVDLLVDGKSGFLVDAEDEDALLERMRLFIDAPERILEFGARGRHLATTVTPEWGAERMEAIAREVVAAHGNKRLHPGRRSAGQADSSDPES